MSFRTRPVATALVALLVGLLALAGCTTGSPAAPGGSTSASQTASSSPSAAAFPRDVKVGETTVHLEKQPASIIVLSPSLTETVYAVGAGDQVKAVDKLSDYPAEVKKSDLDAFTPNIEAIAGMSPDLVLVSNDQGDIVAKLTALKIPVVLLAAPVDLAGVYAQIEQVGELTGQDARAAEVAATTKSRVEAAVAKAKGTTATTYYWELDPTAYYSLSSGTFIGGILKGFGLTSIADKAPGVEKAAGYPQLSAEFIIDADPDIIFAPGGDPAAIRKRSGWDVVRAVKDTDGIVVVDSNIASRWGPRVADLAEAIATGLAKVK